MTQIWVLLYVSVCVFLVFKLDVCVYCVSMGVLLCLQVSVCVCVNPRMCVKTSHRSLHALTADNPQNQQLLPEYHRK